jgi:Glycosyltransferase
MQDTRGSGAASPPGSDPAVETSGSTERPAANAAVYYVDDGYRLDGPKLMGRQSAGNGFLTGFARYAELDSFWTLVKNTPSAESFKQFVSPYRPDLPVHVVGPNRCGALANPGCLYIPAPGLKEFAWSRIQFGDRAWSLCGVIHTLSSAGAMDDITGLLVAPVRAWDAVVCTSAAGKDVVTRLLEAQREYLGWRLGATRVELPQLPIIPLGVDCDAFAPSEDARGAARQHFAIAEHEVVVLFFGRLSFHAKAHPLVMYQALGRAAGARPVVLIEAGQFPNDKTREAFDQARGAACPQVRFVRANGKDFDACSKAWAAADIFCSLSDNIQETFGLTPLEAMAAGLPVVVTHWDGYKDTIRHGVDGFCVPTALPAPGLGGDLAFRHACEIDSYDRYIGHVSQFTAVDVDAAAAAFTQLFASRELCRRMGEAGRRRTREEFDWRQIIPRYQALWAELAERRRAAPADTEAPRVCPARPDPFALFASYPTMQVTSDVRLARGRVDKALLVRFRTLEMVGAMRAVLPPEPLAERILVAIPEKGTVTLQDVLAQIAPEHRSIAARAVVWLAKMAAVIIVPPAAAPRGS